MTHTVHRLIIDAHADLSINFCEQHAIDVLPQDVSVGNEAYSERLNQESRHHFYQRFMPQLSEASVHYSSRDDWKNWLENGNLWHADGLIYICHSNQFTNLFHELQQFNLEFIPTLKSWRVQAGLVPVIRCKSFDSNHFAAAQGLVTWWVQNQLNQGCSADKLTLPLSQFLPSVKHLLLSTHSKKTQQHLNQYAYKSLQSGLNLNHWAKRLRGLNQILYLSANEHPRAETANSSARGQQLILQKTLDQLRQNRAVFGINLSYSGPLIELKTFKEFNELRRYCKDQNLPMMVSLMSPSNASVFGQGALSVAWA